MSKSNSRGTTPGSPFRTIYAICLVKNEDDVIIQTLNHAAKYCEKIFVLDNGSTDRTWELVRSLSQVNPRIVLFAQTFEPFRESLRSLVYYEVSAELSEDDWWLILDGDEFLAEDPQPIIRQAVPEGADVIRAWQISFGFTEEDLRAWEEGRDSRDRPIFERRRYYRIDWQEKRMFRNRRHLSWGDTILPANLKKTCRRRILNRHYPLRDPEQIQKRLLARFGHPTCFRHVTSPDWRHVIQDSQRLVFHREGDPWRFTLSHLAEYKRQKFKRRLRKKWRHMVETVPWLFGVGTRPDE
jgi:glycosyltransferase involved in cell wall biosynthesis